MTVSRSAFHIAALMVAMAYGSVAAAQAPAVGPNVNMVSGTKWPQGDPFLTKQNEASLAVSSRNARHLIAGVNDYRLVPAEDVEGVKGGKAWTQIYKSVDGGASWRSTPMGGCPLSVPECTDPTGLTAALRAHGPTFSADPTMRAGPHGTFFLSFIAGRRDTQANGVIGVQRFVDRNDDIQRVTDLRACTPGSPDCVTVYEEPPSCTGANGACLLKGHFKLKPAEDPILPDVMNIIATGTPGQFNDKPWTVADVGRRKWNGSRTCELLSWTKGRTDVKPAAQTVGAFNVYVSFANFTGQGQNQKPAMYVATSTDCGRTFAKPIKVSKDLNENQGSTSAIDPLTGHAYVAWRNFDGVDGAIYVVKSIDGGASWSTPVRVATFKQYDQGATSASFRTLDFPSIAVSVKDNVSRVHIAWAQRKVAPSTTPPYGCPAATKAHCDARLVVSTSTNGGNTWGAPQEVDPPGRINPALPDNPANPNGLRGHQLQAALTFAAGKLVVTWLDNRFDHTEGVLVCPTLPTTACTNVSQLVEVRRPALNGNLHQDCSVDVSKPPLSTLPDTIKSQLIDCTNPDVVWTPYITDGTLGLVRRHTLDVFTAMADPSDAPVFTSNRVSQYTYGTTVQGTVNPDGSLTPQQGTYEIVQKEVNPPNLPMFAGGTAAFIADYIDVIGQTIVPTGDATQPYKFNVGGNATGPFVTGGIAPAFHVAWTDNRDVIPPLDGNWTNPTCISTAFKKDPNGNVIGVEPTGCGSPGYAGNRNQNIYTAAITEHSLAYAGANSKLLNATAPRGFSVTVRNLGTTDRTYTLTLPAATSSLKASFDIASFSPPTGTNAAPALSATVTVQPRSSASRIVWVTSSAPTAKLTVQVTSTDPPAFLTQVLLNPDANAPLVLNGDGPSTADTANDSLGNVVLSNAVLTNNVLSNNALTNAVLSNNALTNAALSNVVLSNAVLSNDPLVNAVLSNVVLSNAVLSNDALINAVLSNNALTNAALSNNALSNAALTNVALSNVALSNAVLSNNALTNVALSNAALSNAVLTNAALTNAALSNVVLSNAALSNNALSNDPLRNATLSNAPLGDNVNDRGDPEALRTIEVGEAEIAKNSFQSGDLANSDFNFKETTFTIRNRGNTDTTISIKLMLRDAICTGAMPPPGKDPFTCETPPEYKLQLVLRKVSLIPVAIPPTGPAVATGRAIRIGLAQSNNEVSNTSDLPLIDPNDPNFGKFLPEDPKAATLALAAGEYAYATIRAIGRDGAPAPDPADLLRWGVKTVATDALTGDGPLVIRTLNFPTSFVALDPVVPPLAPTIRMFGGKAPITGSAVCTDAEGNTILTGVGPPVPSLGDIGNFYVDDHPANRHLYEKTAAGWGSPTPLIVTPGPGLSPRALVACPPNGITLNNFQTDAAFNTTATATFQSKYWGDFFMLASVKDASAPQQTDRQVIRVTITPRPPVLTYAPTFPTSLTYNQNGQGTDFAPHVSSDSVNGAGVPQPILFSTVPSDVCHFTGSVLFIDNASAPECIVEIKQNGNEIYAPVTQTRAIPIAQAAQTIVVDPVPTLTYNNFGNPVATITAHATSATAPNSGLPVTFSAVGGCATGAVYQVGSRFAADITITAAGSCTITANQAGNRNYQPAPPNPSVITINKADQALTFGAAPAGVRFGDSPVAVTATSASDTAPPPPPGQGQVTFSTSSSTCSTTSAGVVTILADGTCVIAANHPGGSNYNAAPQVTQPFTILRGEVHVTTTVVPTSFVYGDDVDPAAVTITTGSSFAGPGNPAACNVTPFATTEAGVPPAPANAGPYTITSTLTSTLHTSCDAIFTNATLTVNRAPTQFTVPAQQFTPLGSPSTTFTGKLNRTDKPTVFPADAPTVVLKKGTTTVDTYTPTPAGPDGALSVSDTAPEDPIAPESYTLAWSYGGSANFLAATAVTTELRVEGFSAGAVMATARAGHTSTLLVDGNVLVVGGAFDGTGAPTDKAEIYCTTASAPCGAPDVGTFKTVTADLATPRLDHTATRMSDGNVLIAGGAIDVAGTPTATVEVYCAAIGGACTATDLGKVVLLVNTMSTPRAGHAAVLLADGNVLVAGGIVDTAGTAGTPTATTDIYCTAVAGPFCTLPAHVGTFRPAGAMGTPRSYHTATRLNDSNVLVTGGETDDIGTLTDTGELYCHTATATCTAGVGQFAAIVTTMSSVRAVHSATLLADGRVLIAGGDGSGGTPTATADLYCAVAAGSCIGDVGKFKPTQPTPLAGNLVTARAAHTTVVLTDGFPLVIGGRDATTPLLDSELYDPVGPGATADKFATAASMATKRSGAAATRLNDGRVLVTGGRQTLAGPPTNSAELFNGPY